MWQLLAWQTQVLIITGLAIVFALAATLFWLYTKYGMMPQEVLFRGVAVAFAVWSKANHGPGWAFVDTAYEHLVLSEAIFILPPGYPEFATEYESSLPNVLQRAAAWGAALLKEYKEYEAFSDLHRPVVTTAGFVRIDDRIRIGIINYLPPLQSFRAASLPLPLIPVEGWLFPVVIRPWLPILHSNSGPASGNCWIRRSEGQPAILTARHAVRPKRLGSQVKIDVFRQPRTGRLVRASPIMDAAIIEVKQQDWLAKTAVMPSPIIGFKPVRLLSSSGHQDGKIQEITGPTIFAERDKNHLRKIFCLWINFSSPVTPAVLY